MLREATLISPFPFQDQSLPWLKKCLKYLVPALILMFLVATLYSGSNPFERIARSYIVRDFTMGERVLTQFRVLIFYMGLLILPLPSRLNLIHHIETSRSLFDPVTTFLSLLVILGLIGSALIFARRQRVISFCILWFFLHLALESSVVGLEMIYEHRLYLPMVGVSLAAAYMLFQLPWRRRSGAVAAAAALVVLLAAGGYVRNRAWGDPIMFWSDVVKKNPRSHRGFNNLGLAYKREGMLEEAGRSISKALRIRPDYHRAHNNMGLVLQMQERHAESETHFRRSIQLYPRSATARHNLATALFRQGKKDAALRQYRKAVRVNPNYADAHNNLGVTLSMNGDLEEGRRHLMEAIRLGQQRATGLPVRFPAHPVVGCVPGHETEDDIILIRPDTQFIADRGIGLEMLWSKVCQIVNSVIADLFGTVVRQQAAGREYFHRRRRMFRYRFIAYGGLISGRNARGMSRLKSLLRRWRQIDRLCVRGFPASTCIAAGTPLAQQRFGQHAVITWILQAPSLLKMQGIKRAAVDSTASA